MTVHLRTKLTLGILAATTVTFLAVGFVAIPEAKQAVRDRIDDRLLADLPAIRDAVVDAGDAPPAARLATDGDYAVIVVDGASLTTLARSGPGDDPDAPPNLAEVDLPSGRDVTYADAPDGAGYRVATADLGDGRLLAVAAPVDDLSALVDDLIRTFSVIGVVAGAALAVISWWWIRHSTRPIERLTERAQAIAGGDADHRLAVPTRTAEIRRLSHALDAMVASVDASLDVRTRSEARLRQFIANASHELRTPLSSVSGYLQLDVEDAYDDPDHHLRSMARALAETARMGRLVGDLQVLTELDEGETRLRSTVDIGDLLSESAHDATTTDRTRTWTLDLGDEPLAVHADPDQLRQVVGNLIDNVRTHTPPGTTTRISAARDDDTVVIEVADDGPGVPAGALPHLFDRFWREDPSRSRTSGGSGLGLSIVDAIVTSHGGTSTSEGGEPNGLTIRVALPAADAEGPAGRQDGFAGGARRDARPSPTPHGELMTPPG